MSLDTYKHNSSSSAVIASQAAFPASTQGCGGGLFVAIEVSVRSECGEDGLFLSNGKGPWYRWFSDGVVVSSGKSEGLRSLVWVKSVFGRAITLIYSSATSFICLSSRMRLSSYGVLAEIVGKCLGDSTYFESPSLSPELATNMMSPSGSAVILGVVGGLSICRVQFEFILPLLMVNGVAVSG